MRNSLSKNLFVILFSQLSLFIISIIAWITVSIQSGITVLIVGFVIRFIFKSKLQSDEQRLENTYQKIQKNLNAYSYNLGIKKGELFSTTSYFTAEIITDLYKLDFNKGDLYNFTSFIIPYFVIEFFESTNLSISTSPEVLISNTYEDFYQNNDIVNSNQLNELKSISLELLEAMRGISEKERMNLVFKKFTSACPEKVNWNANLQNTFELNLSEIKSHVLKAQEIRDNTRKRNSSR